MNLSERIRPNCEAAPWVVEEVKKLEQQLAQLKTTLDQLANGSHLDAARNHDDDSLREIAGCCTCGQRNRLLRHAGRVDAAMAASAGQEVES